MPHSFCGASASALPPSFGSASSATNERRIVQDRPLVSAPKRRPEGWRQGESSDPTLDFEKLRGIRRFRLSGISPALVKTRPARSRHVLQLCYDRVMSSTTSSFRISDELRIHLESAVSQLGKGKNWILNQALREYLDRMREDSLAAEARRQSLVACGQATPEEQFWAARADDRHWI